MGRTGRPHHKSVVKVVQREDGQYDILTDNSLDREAVTLWGLEHEICVRFGFCGDELRIVLQDLSENGTTILSPFELSAVQRH
jgi:hypothetical protein